jgi:uncharacterized protein (TIGR03435 family)
MICTSISLLLLMSVGQAAPAPAPASSSPATAKPMAYDVVSVRQNKSGSRSWGYRPAPNGIAATNITVERFLQQAYGPVSPRLVTGLPDWTTTQRFDIEGKLDDETFAGLKTLPPAEAWEANKRRMQQILVDRFKLKLHYEQRELPAYALVVAKGGTKLKETDANAQKDKNTRSGYADGELSVDATGMDRFASGLSNVLDREVIDRTGLTGKYDIRMKWMPMRASQDNQASDPADSRASVFAAIQEQLGLKLESTKAMIDTIVVDSIEMPNEN